jgi:hypothetical protein
MSAFDPKAYETAVVKPLRRWTGRELPDDLVSRYAIDLGMSDTRLVQRLSEVRSHWNKSAQSTGKSATTQNLYKAFLRADEELKRAHGPELNKIAWWQRYQRARADKRQGEIDELTQTLRKSFGELGLITAGQLEATMRATFSALSPDEADQALARAGVSIRPPTELPKSSGLQHTVYRRLRTLLTDTQVATVVELLYSDVTSFQILDSFRATPAQPAGLTAQAVESATVRENKRAGNQAAREALGILSHAAKAEIDLRELTLFHLLDGVREHHAQRVPSGALLKQLLQVKLDPAEARQAVFSVLNESTSGPAPGLRPIKELLEAGQLIAAQQVLTTIADPAEASAAKEQVQRHAEQVRRLRDGAHESLRAGNEADALHQLRQAVALAVDDENLAAELRRIPPPPVLEVSAQPDEAGVRVAWRAAASHGEDTRYRVVRREGRAPADPGDGVVVGDERATALVDSKAAAGRLIGYTVFAATDGGTWSRPAGVTIEVLPPVHNVRLTAFDNVVEGCWQVHPDVLAVEVRRGSGTTGPVVRTANKTAFRDSDVAEGADHVYTLVARYRRSDGTEACAPAVVVRTTSHDQVQPVSALTLTPMLAESGSRISIKWRRPGNAEVAVRRAGTACPWEFGAVVPPADLADYGEEVGGFPAEDGEWRSVTADVPTGHFWYVPFTLGPGGAVRGQEAQLGIALPVTGLRYQRLGPEVVLAWSWPEQAGTVEVRWRTATDSDRYRLTRQQYLDTGGCRIRAGQGKAEVQVRSVVSTEGGTCFSAAAELSVPDLPPSVRYTVDMARRPLIGGGTVRVRLTADQSVGQLVVLVVAAHGPVMPRRPADGQVVLRSRQDLAAGHEVELTAELPRLRKPYWVRCFLESGNGEREATQLIDPPTKQLKVP